MMAFFLWGVIAGAFLLAFIAAMANLPHRNQHERALRQYARRQQFAAQQERLKMNMLALETLREMLRQQNRRRF